MPAPAPKPVRTIALMNQKGGVGKTTTTVNLAAGIAALGRSVLLIDMDPQAHASLHLGVDGSPADTMGGQGGPAGSVYDLLLDPDADPRLCIRQVRPNLALIPAETDLAAAESELAPEPDRHKRLAAALAKVEGEYEFVLIDCPPSLGLLTTNALAAVREVLIPLQAHFLALQGMSKLLETVRLVGQSINPRLAVSGVVLCMYDAGTSHSQEVVKDLEEFFEGSRTQDVPWRSARLLRPAIRRNIKLAECPSFGQSVFDYAPTAPGAADYRALAEGLVSEWDAMLARRAGVAAPPPAKRPRKPAGPRVATTPASVPTPPPQEPPPPAVAIVPGGAGVRA
jgi:chromosome partitioning protein